MNFNQFLTQCVALFMLVFVFQSCVEDDDFDVPEIPPIEELQEILSEGGLNASFDGCVFEDFESYAQDQSAFGTYENVTTLNTRLWQVNSFAGNQYLRMSAFAATGDVISYFVIPVDFDSADSFSFKTQDRFSNGDPLEVYIVTDYNIADNIAESTVEFQEITDQFTIATGNTESNTGPFVPSGNYDLSSLSGNGFIAFKYVGNGSGVTSTIHIDDIAIVDNEDDDCEASTGGGGGDPVSQGGENAMALGCISEDWESYSEDEDSFSAYENISTDTGRFWEVNNFSSNNYLELSAFAGVNNPVAVFDSWFVIPVDFDAADTFRFKTQDRFHNGNPLRVYTSTDYTIGSDITAATLNDITASFTIAEGTTTGTSEPFVESGDFDLSTLSGEGVIIFHYMAGGSVSTTIHIDDVEIIDNEDTNCEGNTGGEDSCFDEDFEAFEDGTSVVDGYHNVATVGDLDWTVRTFGDNQYIQMSAFSGNGGNGPHEAWFILGADFDVATGISFDSKDGFNNGDPLTVLHSTNYDEMGDPSQASWTDITTEFDIATGTSSGFADEFTPSGTYDFENLTGNGYVAFVYAGDVNGTTTTIQIDNIELYGESTCSFDLPELDGGGDDEFESVGGDNAMAANCLNEDFESFADETTVFSDYENIAYTGARFWESDSFNDNNYIKMSAFQADGAVLTYFVVPVDFSAAETFSFQSQDRFNNGDVLKVFTTTDHVIGQDIMNATLTDITSSFTIAMGTTGSNTEPFVDSGTFDLSSLSGDGFIVFEYAGNGTDVTTTMHLDNITITDDEDANCDGNGGGGETGDARLNEFHYDDVDGDDAEFIEVRIADDQPTNLGEYRIVLYNGADGNFYSDGNIEGSSETLDNLTVTCADGFCYYVWSLPQNGLQNGAPDGIALVGPDGLIEFISYEGTFTANEGPASGTDSTDVGAEESNSSLEGSSIQRSNDGSSWSATDGTNTSGAANDVG